MQYVYLTCLIFLFNSGYLQINVVYKDYVKKNTLNKHVLNKYA